MTFKALTEMTPDRFVLGMVDAQTTLQAADEDGWLIGGNTSNERTSKTEFIVDAINSLDVKLLNTWGERSIHNWTCAYEHREARQIDFLDFQEFCTSLRSTDV